MGAIIIQYSKSAVADDVGTNFFLKASKSVPRIGRRSMDYENYFLKVSLVKMEKNKVWGLKL